MAARFIELHVTHRARAAQSVMSHESSVEESVPVVELSHMTRTAPAYV